MYKLHLLASIPRPTSPLQKHSNNYQNDDKANKLAVSIIPDARAVSLSRCLSCNGISNVYVLCCFASFSA